MTAGYSFYLVGKRVKSAPKKHKTLEKIARKLKRPGKRGCCNAQIEYIANKAEQELTYYTTLPALAEVAREIYLGAWRAIWKLGK